MYIKVRSALLPLLLMLMLLPGCSLCLFGPHPLRDETEATLSARIKKRVTTKSEIREAFGRPYKIDRFTEDKEYWQYIYDPKISHFDPWTGIHRHFPRVRGSSKSLSIIFSGDVVLTYWMYRW